LRLHIGDVPKSQEGQSEIEGWHRIHSPGSRLGYLLAGLVGFLFPSILLAWLIILSLLTLQRGTDAPVDTGTPWGAVILALLVYIPLHEFLHAVWHPRQGFSSQTVMVVWPARLRFGVYYAGCMTRRRWLMMRLAPLVLLSVVPAGISAVLQYMSASFAVQTFLQVLMLVNGIGSGGDIVAVIWVLYQVPATAHICFLEGKAYWRQKEDENVTSCVLPPETSPTFYHEWHE